MHIGDSFISDEEDFESSSSPRILLKILLITYAVHSLSPLCITQLISCNDMKCFSFTGSQWVVIRREDDGVVLDTL